MSLVPVILYTKKVDTLTHVHDHGMAVEFADKDKQDMMAAMERDGKYVIRAGKSRLEVWRNKEVTYTELHSAAANTVTARMHYLECIRPVNGDVVTLKHRVDDRLCVDRLRTSVFGYNLPVSRDSTMFALSTLDDLRTRMANELWSFAGAAGLRGKAIASVLSVPELKLTKARQEKRGTEHKLKCLVQSMEHGLLETEYRNALKNWKEDVRPRLDAAEGALEELQRSLDTGEALSNECALRSYHDRAQEISRSFYGLPYSPETHSTLSRVHSIHMSDMHAHEGLVVTRTGTPLQCIPAVSAPTHTASVEGDKVVISSGVKCPWTLSQILDALRNGRQLHSAVGALEVQQVSEIVEVDSEIAKALAEYAVPVSQGKVLVPRVLLRCGCHRICPRDTKVPELQVLLQPQHKVTCIPARETYSRTVEGIITSAVREELKDMLLYDLQDTKARLERLRRRNATLDKVLEKRNAWKKADTHKEALVEEILHCAENEERLVREYNTLLEAIPWPGDFVTPALFDMLNVLSRMSTTDRNGITPVPQPLKIDASASA